jgi:hypothetical protein
LKNLTKPLLGSERTLAVIKILANQKIKAGLWPGRLAKNSDLLFFTGISVFLGQSIYFHLILVDQGSNLTIHQTYSNMKHQFCLLAVFLLCIIGLQAQSSLKKHPNTKGKIWTDLFAKDLSNTIKPEGIWSVDASGVLTATEDQCIWTSKKYNDFILDLEFKNADGTNSGVIMHCSDAKDWIPNSVEVQIADDWAEKWATSPLNWQCGALFGRQAAVKQKVVKKPGEWNKYTIMCKGSKMQILLNGMLVNSLDLKDFTQQKVNPDGSEVPAWLSKPAATLPLTGYIGFQGKHAGAPIYFRNMRIREL